MSNSGWLETSHVGRDLNLISGKSGSTIDECIELLKKAFSSYGSLPTHHYAEIYLIRGIGTLPQDGSHAVVFDPEFLFLFDFKFESFAGVSIPWSQKGRGDPDFPVLSRASLRSVPVRDDRTLLYPRVAGNLLLGLANGADEKEVQTKLGALGLSEISITGEFATARCKPFHENSVCSDIESKAADLVRYAEPSRVVRIIDFSPGWLVQKLI